MIPELLPVYQNWLKPIQSHHAAFTTMEGMAEFAVQNILNEDGDFQNYFVTFGGTDSSAYHVKKSIGMEFTKFIFDEMGTKTFHILNENPPNTLELKNSKLYLNRIKNQKNQER